MITIKDKNASQGKNFLISSEGDKNAFQCGEDRTHQSDEPCRLAWALCLEEKHHEGHDDAAERDVRTEACSYHRGFVHETEEPRSLSLEHSWKLGAIECCCTYAKEHHHEERLEVEES